MKESTRMPETPAKSRSPYGSWESPIPAENRAAAGVRLSSVSVDGDDVYWLEGRPLEGGRSVLVVRRPDGTVQDITPDGFNVRTTVHEYGGGAYLVNDGIVYFSNFQDQRIYGQVAGGAPEPLTPETASRVRFSDGRVTVDGTAMYCM